MFDAKKLLDSLIASTSEGAKDLRDNAGNLADQVRNGESGEVLQDFGDKAKNVFGQATEGLKDAAGDIGKATGTTGQFDDIVSQMSGGKSAEELLDQAKDWAGNNKTAAGAIIGGLGAMILGTRTGRGLATGAAKLGGAALIASVEDDPQAAPDGSGFETDADNNDDALRQVRVMIAAAVTDGIIDQEERDKIMGGIRDSGLDPQAYEFLQNEFTNPASIDELTDGVSSEAASAKIYTAARVTIDPQTDAERQFLETLAIRLAIPADLVNHIDAEVSSTRAV